MGSRKLKNYCSQCKKEISRNTISFLCFDCAQEKQYLARVDSWLKEGNVKLAGRPRGYIRKYFYQKQDNKCAICFLNNHWNNKKLEFVLDHINGNSRDNSPENLRLICPNCDSQLPTFKSKNRGKGREYDRKYRIKRYREG